MKTIHIINIAWAVTVLAAGISIITLASGCQTPGRVLSVATSDVCPTCKMQTVSSPIKGLTYTRCICPSCRTETTLDSEQETIVRNYMGVGSDVPTVHVCDQCEAMVEVCPVCREKASG